MRPRIAALVVGCLIAASAIGQDGTDLFKNNCAACHGEGGVGIPGLAPPLAGALKQHLMSADAAAYFARVVASGLSGQIRAGGQIFNGAMPAMAALSNDELAAILAYVTSQLNEAPAGFAIDPADIEKARAQPVSSADVRTLRKALLKEGK